MTTLIRLLSAPWTLFLLLVSGVTIDSILLGRSLGLNASEWASWVQAVGSIAAILVAVAIARRDSNERRRDAYVIAVVAAAEMRQSAMETSTFMESTLMAIDHILASHTPVSDFETLQTRLESWRVWGIDEISRLSPLPNRCALNMARSQACIGDATLLVRTALTRPNKLLEAEFRKERVALLRTILQRAVEHLNAATAVMTTAVPPERE